MSIVHCSLSFTNPWEGLQMYLHGIGILSCSASSGRRETAQHSFQVSSLEYWNRCEIYLQICTPQEMIATRRFLDQHRSFFREDKTSFIDGGGLGIACRIYDTYKHYDTTTSIYLMLILLIFLILIVLSNFVLYFPRDCPFYVNPFIAYRFGRRSLSWYWGY